MKLGILVPDPAAGTPATVAAAHLRAAPWVAAAALAVALGLAAFNAFTGASSHALPPLADGERFVFLPSGDTGQVTVVDGKSDRVVATLEVAGKPHQVALSEPTGTMAVSFAGQRALQIVDLAQPATKSRLELPLVPETMVASPDGYLLAVADSARGAIAIVSLHRRKLLFELMGFSGARQLTFSSDGSQLYVTGRDAGELALIDIVQQSVLRRVPLVRPGAPDAGASALTRTPDGRYGFVALANSDAVLALDLGTLEPVKRLPVGHRPSRPYGTADGRLMLVPNEGDGSVSIIDTQALAVSATLPAVPDVAAINTGWFESLAFVTSRSDRRVAVLDLMGFRRLADIELPAAPGPGVVNSSGQKLYVSLADTDQLAIIDTQRHDRASIVAGAGHRPSGVVMARTNNYCH
jgi:DNA-binding beta-propeller fold protein YncE